MERLGAHHFYEKRNKNNQTKNKNTVKITENNATKPKTRSENKYLRPNFASSGRNKPHPLKPQA